MLDSRSVQCPYCGETVAVAIDASGGDQVCSEHCQVCCRPMILRISVDDRGQVSRVQVAREDD
jgi:hypothetical protein